MADKTKLNDASKRYYKKNRGEVIKYRIAHNSTPKGKFVRYTYSAKRRGIEFNLNLEEFSSLISQECSYCGSKESVGVDRIDNDLSYTTENSTPCCTMCNMMKKNLPLDIFIEHCQKISAFNSV